MPLLNGVNLTHAYDYTLFTDLNFSISKKESFAIVGISGCGKSTLLHILSTLLKPDKGEVFYQDKSIYNLSSDDKVAICRYDFGIIFQSHYLFKGLTALENIELATILSSKKLDFDLLEKLKISNVLEKKVGNLSGGQQQRVSIARILSKKPKIIFADEPTGNLDKITANEVMNILFEYVEENDAALVLVTHDRELASKCTTSHLLENQRLIKLH